MAKNVHGTHVEMIYREVGVENPEVMKMQVTLRKWKWHLWDIWS